MLITFPDGFKCYTPNVEETELMYNEIYIKQEYLQHGLTFDDVSCVFDIGANVGIFTLFVKSRNPHAVIHAFEPIPDTYDVLRLNVELHHLIDVYTHPVGLGSQIAAQQTFTYYPNLSGSSTSVPAIKKTRQEQMEKYVGKAKADFFYESETRSAPIQTISSFLDEQDIQAIDFIKIDTEGSELDILQGIAEKHIPRIQQFALEVHTPQIAQEVRDLLSRMGFKVVSDTGLISMSGSGLSEIYATRAPAKPA